MLWKRLRTQLLPKRTHQVAMLMLLPLPLLLPLTMPSQLVQTQSKLTTSLLLLISSILEQSQLSQLSLLPLLPISNLLLLLPSLLLPMLLLLAPRLTLPILRPLPPLPSRLPPPPPSRSLQHQRRSRQRALHHRRLLPLPKPQRLLRLPHLRKLRPLLWLPPRPLEVILLRPMSTSLPNMRPRRRLPRPRRKPRLQHLPPSLPRLRQWRKSPR